MSAMEIVGLNHHKVGVLFLFCIAKKSLGWF